MRDKSKQVNLSGPLNPRSAVSREAYASDGSIYRILPEAVVLPVSADEAVAAAGAARRKGLTITARGGGTGLAGGALGRGVVIDCSRLTAIENIDGPGRRVTCQPGIIYRDLNLALKEHGLFFPPDPSSGDSCQIGGMLANNSSGPRSVKYGLTSDYVEALTLINGRGEPITVGKMPLGSDELTAFLSRYPEYRTILDLLTEKSSLIRENWPNVRKNSAGYNLRRVVADLDAGIFNLPALYVGSEGTLGLFLSVTLRLLPLPEPSLSFRLFFSSLEDAGEAVTPLLATGPSALEIVDGSTLDLIGRDEYGVPASAEAMLLLEYDDDHERHRHQLQELAPRLKLTGPHEEAADAEQRDALWAARRAIVPILYRHHASRRPFAFIEDASLPVDKLTEFIAWIRRRLEGEGLTFGLFGHIGDGNLHIRPLLDIARSGDYDLMQRLYRDVYEHMIALGGSSTAEHADGRLRAPLVRDIYGPEIYDSMVRIKKALDPDGSFNPDVILSDRPFTDDIDFKKLELTCAACGKCNGYCPAYEIFRREDMSARGWLRMLHAGVADDDELASFYRYCLNCKNCTTVCPAGVDIAGEILRFKSRRPQRLAGRIIGLFDRKRMFGRLLKAGARLNPLVASKAGRVATAVLGGKTFGFDRDVELPPPAKRTLRERHPDLTTRTGGIALFHGCADNYFDSPAGDALIRVYEHYGLKPALPEQDCCGLPMEVYGHRDNLIEKARKNIDSLAGFDAVVFTCASCQHRLADYHELFAAGSAYHEKALALKARLHDACQYLWQQDIKLPRAVEAVDVTYHHPCHLRAAGLEKEPLTLLQGIPGVTLVHPELAGRCCGQAGSFGFIHYREGAAIFDRKRDEYRQLGAKIIVSSCPSCISKIKKEMGPAYRVCHPLELLADAIEGRALYEADG